MYVFDTNVLSEVMRDIPDPGVVAWLEGCKTELMYTTAVSRSEIFYGVWLVADSSKRQRLERAARDMFAQAFLGRVLTFDEAAADAHADIRIVRKRSGMPISTEDAMIAAIAKVHGATVVTRDEGGFAGCGVTVINPWTVGA